MALNILIVDDCAVMRSMIAKTIKMCGFGVGEIFEASNGQEGLKILSEKWIDLFFIDVNMPVMDGMEMLGHVRANPDLNDLPVVIVSTESNEERIKTLDQSHTAFVHKPFTPELLRKKILDMLAVSK